jgi:hypothetical protein
MTLAKAKARANETFIVQVSLTIVTYDHQNIFIIQATDYVPFQILGILDSSYYDFFPSLAK